MNRREFLDGIFTNIARCLTPNGMVTMQCCSEFDRQTLALLPEILSSLFEKLHFKTSFIPSFCENWIFGSARAAERVPLSQGETSPDRHKIGL